MPEADNDELFELRYRAYGRGADIQGDPAAVDRLRDLENAAKPTLPEALPFWANQQQDPSSPVVEAAGADEGAPLPTDDEAPARGGRRARAQLSAAYGFVRRARRSSVLLTAGVVVVSLCALVAVILVQRVQVDPLQAGATQVARLAVDSSYEVPPFFLSGDGDQVFGFEQFHGLRAVVSESGIFTAEASQTDKCLSVFPEKDMLESRSGSFSGLAYGACAAGAFPAMIQFKPDNDGFPDELRSAFPNPSALQFVYDRATNEVVVFVDAS